MVSVKKTGTYFNLMHKINKYHMTLQPEYIYNHIFHIKQNGSHSNIPIAFVPHFWLNKDIPCLKYMSSFLKKQTIQLKLLERFPG